MWKHNTKPGSNPLAPFQPPVRLSTCLLRFHKPCRMSTLLLLANTHLINCQVHSLQMQAVGLFPLFRLLT